MANTADSPRPRPDLKRPYDSLSPSLPQRLKVSIPPVNDLDIADIGPRPRTAVSASPRPRPRTSMPPLKMQRLSTPIKRQNSLMKPTKAPPKRTPAEIVRILRLEKRTRKQQISSIFTETKRLREPQPLDGPKGIVHLRLQIEKCSYLETAINGSHCGNVRRDVREFAKIQTIHAPLQNVYATQYKAFYAGIWEMYAKNFEQAPGSHRHRPGSKGTVVVELSIRLYHFCTIFQPSEENWSSTLAKLALNNLMALQNRQPEMVTAMVIAKFACSGCVSGY